MTDINEIFARLNPTVRDKVIKATESTNSKQVLPSLWLTATMGGGIGYGKQTLIWGNRSSGKTLFSLQTTALAQQEDRGCAWVDAEHNYDKDWSARLGVNNDQLMLTHVTAIGDVADAVADMLRAGIEFVTVDSISALLPESFYDDKDEMKAFADTGQIGQFSRDIGTVTKMLNSKNHKAALVLISQIRTNLGGFHASLKPMGGLAVDHFNSTSLKVWSTTTPDDQIKGDMSHGDYIYQTLIGRKVNWTIDKNRGPGMGETGSYDMYYKGDFVGIDCYSEAVKLGGLMGLVEKSGTWYTLYGEKFQGDKKAGMYLRENPDIYDKLKAEILESV